MAGNRLLHLIDQNNEAILNINTKRNIWTWSFLLVLLSSFILLLCWLLQTEPRTFGISKPCAIFAIISWVNWWAWTMVLLSLLLSQQNNEVELMVEISADLHSIGEAIHMLWEHHDEIHADLKD